MTSRRPCTACALASLFALAACGGGGTSPAGAVAPVGPAIRVAKAEREMPDYRMTATLAADGTTLTITLRARAGVLPAISAVTACCATDDTGPTIYHALADLGGGVHAGPVDRVVGSAARIWVRVDHADGSSVASGIDDFAVAGL